MSQRAGATYRVTRAAWVKVWGDVLVKNDATSVANLYG